MIRCDSQSFEIASMSTYLEEGGVVAIVDGYACGRSSLYCETDFSLAHDDQRMKVHDRSLDVGSIVGRSSPLQ